MNAKESSYEEHVNYTLRQENARLRESNARYREAMIDVEEILTEQGLTFRFDSLETIPEKLKALAAAEGEKS